jgi:hypothetical protein
LVLSHGNEGFLAVEITYRLDRKIVPPNYVVEPSQNASTVQFFGKREATSPSK